MLEPSNLAGAVLFLTCNLEVTHSNLAGAPIIVHEFQFLEASGTVQYNLGNPACTSPIRPVISHQT
jgi:hypothetical protein